VTRCSECRSSIRAGQVRHLSGVALCTRCWDAARVEPPLDPISLRQLYAAVLHAERDRCVGDAPPGTTGRHTVYRPVTDAAHLELELSRLNADLCRRLMRRRLGT
jgi:hypothetical protein